MSKRARNTLLFSTVLLLAVLATATAALGVGSGSAARAQNPLAAIKNDTQAIRAAVTNRGFGLREIKREIRVIQTRSNRLEVEAEVNEAACASVPVQCGDGTTGHTFAPASSANHNPVEIVVLVTLNGVPVPGLAATAFDFSNRFVPAGGPGAVLCPAGGSGCASPSNLFQDGTDGTYAMWAHPAPAGNWKSGAYHGRISVTGPGGVRGSTLIELNIP
jgi:hypothetical protein